MTLSRRRLIQSTALAATTLTGASARAQPQKLNIYSHRVHRTVATLAGRIAPVVRQFPTRHRLCGRRDRCKGPQYEEPGQRAWNRHAVSSSMIATGRTSSPTRIVPPEITRAVMPPCPRVALYPPGPRFSSIREQGTHGPVPSRTASPI